MVSAARVPHSDSTCGGSGAAAAAQAVIDAAAAAVAAGAQHASRSSSDGGSAASRGPLPPLADCGVLASVRAVGGGRVIGTLGLEAELARARLRGVTRKVRMGRHKPEF